VSGLTKVKLRAGVNNRCACNVANAAKADNAAAQCAARDFNRSIAARRERGKNSQWRENYGPCISR
jgi:hypothetical protein